MAEYTVTPETVEATIKRQLTYAQATSAKEVKGFREQMKEVDSITHLLQWHSATVVGAEFAYHQYTKTLGRVGREECSLVESINETRASLEHALIANQWTARSTSGFHNAADAATADMASQLVQQFKDWSDQAKEHGLI
tara:strand:- start:52 stop:468 length:417 start_codon:yes stop_codon:yes gene_type:complete